MNQLPSMQGDHIWQWKNYLISWKCESQGKVQESYPPVLLIHGFGACKEHWRYNQKIISKFSICYSIDLIGFGQSSKPKSRLNNEICQSDNYKYDFDSWSQQIADFCKEIINRPVILVGNSIGGVIALRAANILQEVCKEVVLIDCAQRTMDDKRLAEQKSWMRWSRPLLKYLVKQRWLSKSLFTNAANRFFIKKVLQQAYPSGENIDNELIEILYAPTQSEGAPEAFRGFINLFDDYLAPDLLKDLTIPVNIIWGEDDPWEPIDEAKKWVEIFPCIQSFSIIPNSGHCPHDEKPEVVNQILLKIIQHAT